MSQVSKTEFDKDTRDKIRFFASELIKGLQGRHIRGRWVPVTFEDEDRLEPELNNSELLERPATRTFGPGRSTVFSQADYRAMEVYPEWRDADGQAYRIVLGEPTLDWLKVRWHKRGWICAHCAYPLEVDEEPNHDIFCPWGWLMTTRLEVFIKNGEKGFQRNPDVSKEQSAMTLELLAEAHVLEVLDEVG